MREVFVAGVGAVSPAGWNASALNEAVKKNEPLPTKDLSRPGVTRLLRVRTVPAPNPKPAFLAHARMRRTSPIALHAVSAALEALGDDAAKVSSGELRLGIIVCVMSGCVNYSRRFYDETLRDPAIASPVLFPETVFNAPGSHLGALLGTTAVNYTLVGDPGTFLQGIALAADWLQVGRVDCCLVAGAEEMDWLVSDAFSLFDRRTIVSDGAGALYLRLTAPQPNPVKVDAITDPHLFSQSRSRKSAVECVKQELGRSRPEELMIDGLQGIIRVDSAEQSAWKDWSGPRLSPKKILGEGLMASAAWQCVLAVQDLWEGKHKTAVVSIVGCNQQAIAARFALPGRSRI